MQAAEISRGGRHLRDWVGIRVSRQVSQDQCFGPAKLLFLMRTFICAATHARRLGPLEGGGRMMVSS